MSNTVEDIRIIEPPKEKFSWVNGISSIKHGESVYIPKEFSSSVCSIISREMKWRFPERKYTTDQSSNDKYMIVRRDN